MKKISLCLAVVSVLTLAGPASAQTWKPLWHSKSKTITLAATQSADHKIKLRLTNEAGRTFRFACNWHEVARDGSLVQRHWRGKLYPTHGFLPNPKYGPDASDLLPRDASCHVRHNR